MEVIIQPDQEAASALAAALVARLVADKPDAVIGLCAGNTPLLLYRELIRRHREEKLDFSRVTTFNLDEYVGIPPNHPASYGAFMQNHLLAGINVDPSRSHSPDGLADNILQSCELYEDLIKRSGGIDLQLLGIGVDGHLGFNEPSSSLASRTRIKTLTERTRSDNARPFGKKELVPRHVVTMGLGTILDARHCLLLAFGFGKASAVAKMVEGPVAAAVPASVLQLHPRVRVIIDEEAASQLRLADYYRAVYEGKPEWQAI